MEKSSERATHVPNRIRMRAAPRPAHCLSSRNHELFFSGNMLAARVCVSRSYHVIMQQRKRGESDFFLSVHSLNCEPIGIIFFPAQRSAQLMFCISASFTSCIFLLFLIAAYMRNSIIQINRIIAGHYKLKIMIASGMRELQSITKKMKLWAINKKGLGN